MGLPHQPQIGLGEAIRRARARRGMTQEELAHRAGLTTGTLSLIERGRSNPTWATVKALAAALDVTVASIATQADKLESPAKD